MRAGADRVPRPRRVAVARSQRVAGIIDNGKAVPAGGGGVIGLELGSVWGRLGAKVTAIEYLDQILPGFDGEVRKESAKLFKKQGMDLKTSTKVTGASLNEKGMRNSKPGYDEYVRRTSGFIPLPPKKG